MFIMRRDPALLGGDLMIRPVPKFAGRRPDDSSRTQIRWEES